jgi:hypothetical protein
MEINIQECLKHLKEKVKGKWFIWPLRVVETRKEKVNIQVIGREINREGYGIMKYYSGANFEGIWK